MPTNFFNLPCGVLTTTQALAMRQVPQALQVVAAVVLSDAASSKKIKTLCRHLFLSYNQSMS
jgi:hypothetical protein